MGHRCVDRVVEEGMDRVVEEGVDRNYLFRFILKHSTKSNAWRPDSIRQ